MENEIKEDKDFGDSFEYEGEVYVKCDTEEQLSNLLSKWEYMTIEEFLKETGVKKEDLIGKFWMASGKQLRVYYLPEGDEVEYKDRKFEDNATGEVYTGAEFLEVDPKECIWEITEVELTKDLKLGETAHTIVKPELYDREHHVTDFVDIRRIE